MINSWDYKNEYKYLKKDILKAINKVFKSGKLFFGNEAEKFEKSFFYNLTLPKSRSPLF